MISLRLTLDSSRAGDTMVVFAEAIALWLTAGLLTSLLVGRMIAFAEGRW